MYIVLYIIDYKSKLEKSQGCRAELEASPSGGWSPNPNNAKSDVHNIIVVIVVMIIVTPNSNSNSNSNRNSNSNSNGNGNGNGNGNSTSNSSWSPNPSRLPLRLHCPRPLR